LKRQLIRFAIAGFVGFVVDAGLLYGALWVGLGYFVGRIISFFCAVITTWAINRRLAFRGRSRRPWLVEFVHYLMAMILGGAVNYAAYSLVVLMAPRTVLTPLIAVAVGVAAGMSINFLSAKFWVFRTR
jgi:putative flippase GtrA